MAAGGKGLVGNNWESYSREIGGMNFTIKLDSKEVEKALKEAPKAAEKAAIRTLNRTADKARVAASKAVRETYNIKAGDLSKSVKITRASQSKLETVLTIVGKPVGLIAFAARKIAKGVTYKILKSSGRDRLPHAFIATMKSGHRGVFERTGKARLPIRERKFITMPSVWKSKKVMSVIERVVNTEIVKEWKANWEYYRGKGK